MSDKSNDKSSAKAQGASNSLIDNVKSFMWGGGGATGSPSTEKKNLDTSNKSNKSASAFTFGSKTFPSQYRDLNVWTPTTF